MYLCFLLLIISSLTAFLSYSTGQNTCFQSFKFLISFLQAVIQKLFNTLDGWLNAVFVKTIQLLLFNKGSPDSLLFLATSLSTYIPHYVLEAICRYIL